MAAGQDIFNLSFLGQILRDDDIVSIAGRDIFDSPNLALSTTTTAGVPSLALGGPGTFYVQAGRNIGPLTNQQQVYDIKISGGYNHPTTGIDAIGNADTLGEKKIVVFHARTIGLTFERRRSRD